MVRISIIQTRMSKDKEENVNRQIEMVNKAADNGADIVVLDELSTTIYFAYEQDPKYFSLAEEERGTTIAKFKDISKERKIGIVLPIFERDNFNFYNTAFIISDGEILGKYRKTHLPQDNFFNEYYYFKIGDLGFPVFQVKGTKLGTVICHDRHFPETVRSEVIKGAWIVIIPSVAYFKEIWELELKAHAVFNTSYIVGVNRVGKEYEVQKEDYFGESMIISPMGEVISKAGKGEEILTADISEDEVIRARIARPFLKKRLSYYEL
ncbi:carbon-nitrogen hydrolase family protein [Acidianus sp. RZ1]|uniref:carbon-nitrogen hydrolase family protein n=1 Tax=Acidianus sp. RZ1 TaxID=1540082 RepID=UPI00149252D1|nr:nitrilase-related carbon-nitrogen hydrolase [Acidianus sp. RZ1]NON62300.1 hypothetical protein [Acidianus sp. RZ1]